MPIAMTGRAATGVSMAWQASRRDDLVSIVTGTWLAVGLFVDGWAHNNLRSLETFFTPWHGLLYSGFAATAAWYLGLAVRGARRRPADATRPRLAIEAKTPVLPALDGLKGRIPVGYGWGTAGVFIFGAGGLGDMAWHLAFGIEQGIDALFSPTHVVLAVGLLALLAAPLRAAWGGPTPRERRSDPPPATRREGAEDAPPESPRTRGPLPWRELTPAIASATLVAATIAFFFMHAWPTIRPFHAGRASSPFPFAGGEVRSAAITAGSSGMLIMTLVLVGTLLWLACRWRLPFGTATLVFTAVGTLMSAIGAFAHWPLVVAQAVAGIATDSLAARLDPSPDRPGAFRAFAFLAALLLWVAVLSVDWATRGIGWSREVTSGAVAWSCLAATALAAALSMANARTDSPANLLPDVGTSTEV